MSEIMLVATNSLQHHGLDMLQNERERKQLGEEREEEITRYIHSR